MAAQADIRYVLWFTILVNVNLAIFNLLPIPVLDGGHMLFATIGKLRGRALPPEFIATTQSVFMVILFSMMIYVSFFDVRRWSRDAASDRPKPAATEPVAAPAAK
jgi:regulator of sigma E protease